MNDLTEDSLKKALSDYEPNGEKLGFTPTTLLIDPDIFIAEKVMEWYRGVIEETNQYVYWEGENPKYLRGDVENFKPFDNLKDAFKVVEKLGKDHYFHFERISDDVIRNSDTCGIKYRCFFRCNSNIEGHGQSDSLSEAICLAALEVKGLLE